MPDPLSGAINKRGGDGARTASGASNPVSRADHLTSAAPPSSGAKRWDVTVLPDVIDAADENEARAEFIQALVEDGSLIYVSEHSGVDIDVTGTDEFGV